MNMCVHMCECVHVNVCMSVGAHLCVWVHTLWAGPLGDRQSWTLSRTSQPLPSCTS